MESTLAIWSQFGLAGIVIGTLFAGFGIVGRYVLAQLKKNDDSQHQFLLQVVSEHKQERAEWRQSIKEMTEHTVDALEKNTLAIQRNTDALQTVVVQTAKGRA